MPALPKKEETGGESHISGGNADLGETTDAPVEENKYNSKILGNQGGFT
jgi:hypothetical protein